MGRPIWPSSTDRFNVYASEGYAQNPDVYACIRLIATSVAGIDWSVYKIVGDELKLDEAHPLNLLLDRPNPFQSRATFMEVLVSYLLLHGNFYCEKVGPERGLNGGKPKELYLLRPDRVMVIKDANGYPAEYEYTSDNGRKLKISAKDILHKSLFNPMDDHYGLSPMKPASYSIDIANESRHWNMALLQNSGRPSGAIVTEATVTKDQYETIKNKINSEYTGSSNAGKPLILSGGMSWQTLGLSPAEMSWEQTIKMATREICAVFHVPPELIGDHEHATYSNYQEARKAFYEETILPLMDSLKGDLNAWLTPLYGNGYILDYDRDDIEALKEDRDAVWKRAIEGVKNGIITINDARDMLKLEAVPIPEADQLLIPFNLMPLSSAVTADKEPQDTPEVDERPGNEEEEDHPEEDEKNSKDTFSVAEKKSREASWRLQADKRKQAWWPLWTKAAMEEFEKEEQSLSTALKKLDNTDDVALVIDKVLEKHQASWLKMYTKMYKNIAEEFAQPVFDLLKSHGRFDHKSLDWNEEYFAFIERTALFRIKNISNTTKLLVLQEIDKGIASGDTLFQIADRVTQKYDDFSQYRALTAARTEVNAAANYGSQLAAKSTGLPVVKRWLSYIDDRTRDGSSGCDHISADGQERQLDQPYDISGEQLMFPGDVSMGASAGNVVNCRCTEIYEVVG